jgi:hypothetical protein
MHQKLLHISHKKIYLIDAYLNNNILLRVTIEYKNFCYAR